MRSALLSSRLALVLAVVPSIVPAQIARPDEPTLVARLGALADSLATAGAFSGVIVLAHDDAPVFEHAYGIADRATGRPIRLTTEFNLGSVDKLFTATAVRQLADAGRLDLDAPIARAWPDYPNRDVAQRVTPRQLLTMSSGIEGDIFHAPAGRSLHDLRHNRDALPLFVGAPLAYEPGTRRRYSNAGFVVLGALVERVTGQDYYAYVREHVFTPAGMTHTGSWAIDSLPADAAIGYTRRVDPASDSLGADLHANTDLLPGRGSAAGGGYSTAGDMLRYLSAVRAGRLPSMYPGWVGGSAGANTVVEGGLPGGYQLIILANVDPPVAQDIAQRVHTWLGVTRG